MVAVSRSRHRKTGFTLPLRMSDQPPNLDDTPIEPLYTHPASPFLQTESTAPAHVEMPTPAAFQSTWVTYRTQIEFGLAMLAYLMVLVGSVTVLQSNPGVGWRYVVTVVPVAPAALTVLIFIRPLSALGELHKAI